MIRSLVKTTILGVVAFLLSGVLVQPVAAKEVIYPLQDTMVKKGYPNRNYGDSEKQRSSSYRYRDPIVSYLQFDLSEVTSQIEKIDLVVYPSLSRTIEKEVYTVLDQNWDENEMTWDTMVMPDAKVGEFSSHRNDLEVEKPYTIPLDTNVLNAYRGQRLTLMIMNTDERNTFDYYTSESDSYKPYLEITTSTDDIPDDNSGDNNPIPGIVIGDVNQDRIVDIFDYYFISSILNTNYQISDFNHNSHIDIFDVAEVVRRLPAISRHYGSEGPEPTPTPTPTTEPTPEPTIEPVDPSPEPTNTPEPTPVVTPTPTPIVEPPPLSQGNGIWISAAEAQALPKSGPGWDNLLNYAQRDTSQPELGNQDSMVDVYTMAKALAYAATGDTRYRNEVVSTLKTLVETHPLSESRRWGMLSVLRGLGSYVIAADTIQLSQVDPAFDQQVFRPWLSAVRTASTEGGRGTLISGHELRPNNWGTHAAASRIATDLYLGDEDDLRRAVDVFHGYLGAREIYSDRSNPGFDYGSDLSWQCNPSEPVGINPLGCQKNGHNIGGVIPDDQRRCGSFGWPPCPDNYAWEGLQGVVTAAEILYRAGYPVYQWEDQAVLRAVEWLNTTTFSTGESYPAKGDDVWIIWIINRRYGTNYKKSAGTQPGKMVGYTDWTHQ